MTISVIIGSTRQGRFSEKPAQWIFQQFRKREGIEARLSRPPRFSHAFLRPADAASDARAADLRTRRCEKIDLSIANNASEPKTCRTRKLRGRTG
jgi:hypothetical protein